MLTTRRDFRLLGSTWDALGRMRQRYGLRSRAAALRLAVEALELVTAAESYSPLGNSLMGKITERAMRIRRGD